MMNQISETSMKMPMRMQSYRDINIAINRRFLQQKFRTNEENKEIEAKNEINDM